MKAKLVVGLSDNDSSIFTYVCAHSRIISIAFQSKSDFNSFSLKLLSVRQIKMSHGLYWQYAENVNMFNVLAKIKFQIIYTKL